MTDPTNSPLEDVNPEEFQRDLTGHVFGIVDNPKVDLPAITNDLLEADVPFDGVHLYCCALGVESFDPRGTRHGLRGRIARVMQSLVYEDQLSTIERNLEDGHALVGVDVSDVDADRIAAVLRKHGGHDIVHYGHYTWRRLSAATRTPPVESEKASP